MDTLQHSNARSAVEHRRAAWRARIEAETGRLVSVLSACPEVQQVIVFGSQASQGMRYHSDIDLVVVQRTARRYVDRLEELYRLLQPRVPTDLVVYTPEEWRDMSVSQPFARRVREHGKVLYAANAG